MKTVTGLATQWLPAPIEIVVAWDEDTNKLRVARPIEDTTIAVFSNGAVYKMAGQVPTGQVVICPPDGMPDLANTLCAMGVISEVTSWIDPQDGSRITIGLVLL